MIPDLDALKSRLARFEARYDELLLGLAPQQLGSDRETVAYTPADLDRLGRAIESLKREIATAEGRRRPPGGGYLRVI